MNRPAQISFALLALLLFLAAYLNLGTFLLSSLFGYLALKLLDFHRGKVLTAALYLLVVISVGSGLIYFTSLGYRTLPKIAENAIPAMVEFAEKNGIDLPFTDYSSLRVSALAAAREGLDTVGRYARIASFQTILLIAGLAVALGVYLNPAWTKRNHGLGKDGSAYSQVVGEMRIRFSKLYDSFAKVIGAQITISAINTGLSALFLFLSGYRFAILLLILVFLCGLIPIVGNLLSNAVIVGVGFTMSPKIGILALIFLITIHKLEYFLDSKIIGQRIDSPMWLTLIGLLVGERVMGIPGMILAPVLLHYIKVETSAYRFPASSKLQVPVLGAEPSGRQSRLV